jgi:hypothetical protein
MAVERKVYLIPYEQAVKIPDIPDPIMGDAYSTALAEGNEADVEGAPAWATAETLEGLKTLGMEPEILKEWPVLPVFHGISRYIETVHYVPVLSCLAYAKFDEAALGVAYIGFNCEREVWQMGLPDFKDYFFYYSQNNSRDYIWAVVVEECEEMAGFLYNIMYHQDQNMLAWLRNMGLDPLAGEDKEEEE